MVYNNVVIRGDKMSIIKVENLSFKYDEDYVVDDISFNIEQGSFVTIIGHNGSGKSTVAKLLIGLLEKNSGKITIDGLELDENNLYAIRDRVGIVFQNPDNQFIGSTVRDDIAFGLENHCVEHNLMDGLIETFSQKVSMNKYLDSEPTKLSGGQKQRVAIAGVLAMNPKIIIFDEATSMLDPQGKKEINELIGDIRKENNTTIISITHDIEEVTKSDFVIVMNDGKIACSGTPSEVLVQEKLLVDMKLDIPFSLKLKNELAKEKINVNPVLTIEGMVVELCRLSSKN